MIQYSSNRLLLANTQKGASDSLKRRFHLHVISSSHVTSSSGLFQSSGICISGGSLDRRQRGDYASKPNSIACVNSTFPPAGNSSNYNLQPCRNFSDSLLGYSPMAQHKSIKSSTSSKTEKSPGLGLGGVDSNNVGGGVWEQKSAKRDKLAELKMELKIDLDQYSLDDLATEEEKLDLYLVDGVNSIATMIDGGGMYGDLNLNDGRGDGENVLWKNCIESVMNDFIEEKKGNSAHSTSGYDDDGAAIMITKEEYERLFCNMIEKVKVLHEEHLATPKPDMVNVGNTINDERNQTSPLLQIRDFLFYDPPNPDEAIPIDLRQSLYEPISKPFLQCYEYFQVILVQTALDYFSSQWDEFVKISSADQDRAATRGELLDDVKTLDLMKVHDVLNSYATGSCSDRVEALWKLMDRDNDGMLDQEEMDRVVYMSIRPVESAIQNFFTDCIEVWPVRKMGLPPPPSSTEREESLDSDLVQDDADKAKKKNLGFYAKWKQEKKEKSSKKLLFKLLDATIKNRFDVEVEIAHRLRCVYAFAEKEHQKGRTQSVLVDASTDALSGSGNGGFSIGAKKRYVELDPKISYPEFLEVQKKYFSHLDRVGQELCTSLKEDLWVHQGRGRQNLELKRETLAFLAVVSIIDYFININ